ncbi:hypothetical protein [uncultured Brevibacillus sp.]|uniref:hypothetical protein n=1 Tax=uncultured Brevibacillus sp. TaxID=169970 RepID=UPI00259681C9|nr:hypothetical protein [uncultured Brevibacillus sp.]
MLNEIKRSEIPWQQLTTAYGRGSELPLLMDQGEYAEIANLIEHQSTLWQVTPWVLLFMLRDLKTKSPEDVMPEEIKCYLSVTDAFSGRDVGEWEPVPQMKSLLDDAFLWPEDEEEDELLWEEDEPPGYAEQPFTSYYYYSYQQLRDAVPVFENIRMHNQDVAELAAELLEQIKQLG